MSNSIDVIAGEMARTAAAFIIGIGFAVVFILIAAISASRKDDAVKICMYAQGAKYNIPACDVLLKGEEND